MADYKLIGKNYTTPDILAKVTGRAKYAEDFRAEGMLFTKLLVSPMPHARVRRMDTSAAMAMPGVEAILTADDLPEAEAPPGGIGGATGYRYWTLSVSNLDEATTEAEEAGRKVVISPREIRPGIKISMIEDPDGNWVELLQVG